MSMAAEKHAQTSGMLFTYYQKSAYHDSCIPPEKRQATGGQVSERKHTEAEYKHCDLVTQDKVWTESVNTEKRGLKSWQENWGFLAELDAKSPEYHPNPLLTVVGGTFAPTSRMYGLFTHPSYVHIRLKTNRPSTAPASRCTAKYTGNKKEVEPLPEKEAVFSENVPNTNSGNYGSRVHTKLGMQMQQLEYKFYSGGRRRKMGNDMICY